MNALRIVKKLSWRGVLLGTACALAAWLLSQWSVVRGGEEWMQDGCFQLRYQLRGKRSSGANIVLIGLDEASLAALKKPLLYLSPELAEVVTFVKGQGAAAVGLDLILPEWNFDAPELQAREVGDVTRLGQAIKDVGNVVLAEFHVAEPKKNGGKAWLLPPPQWRLKALDDDAPTDLAFVNLTEDDDFFFRRQLLFIPGRDKAHLHFALALFAVARGLEVKWDEDRSVLLVGKEPIPLDSEQKLRVNFVGPPGSFPVTPFRDVLAAARAKGAPPASFQDAIVIIGLTEQSSQDYHVTPFANDYARYVPPEGPRLMSGVELHANLLATLTDRGYIHTPPWLASLLVLLLFGAALGELFARLSLAAGFAVALLHHWAWKGICIAAFSYGAWRVEIVPMLLLGVFAYGSTLLLRWWVLRRMLGMVKSEAIARLLENDPGQLDRRGEERIVTVLFADIRSFTDYSEKHGAREVVALLNAYFGAVVPIIEQHGGTLDKYMGDGIMVIFGAPVALEDHALQAVRAAVAIVRRVHELKKQWAELGNPTMRIGVGVHFGPVIAGTVGSARRQDYTIIGDTVNAAARIEAQDKEFGTEILISAETYRELPSKERQPLGCSAESQSATVKGKGQTLYLHTVSVESTTA